MSSGPPNKPSASSAGASKPPSTAITQSNPGTAPQANPNPAPQGRWGQAPNRSAAAKVEKNATTAAWALPKEDSQMNPFNNKVFSSEYRQILQESRRLPVAGQRQEFLDLYQNEQVMIVVSETGSGKSTQIPKFVLYDELAGNGKIPITQTRRLAAISVAEQVAQELDVVYGEEVGFAISPAGVCAAIDGIEPAFGRVGGARWSTMT